MPDITNDNEKIAVNSVQNFTLRSSNDQPGQIVPEGGDTTQPREVTTLDQASTMGSTLLGVYNENDEYVVAPAILEELFAVKKLKKTTFRNSVFCTAYLPDYGDLTFEIIYEKNSKNQTAKATMFLLEKEYKVNGYLQNTLKTKVGEYIADLDSFVENSYREFNVHIAPVGSGRVYNIAEDDKQQGYVIAKQQFNALLAQASADDCKKLYEAYFTQRLQLLNDMGTEFSQEILAQFKVEFAKIEKFFLSTKDYRSLSELLDKCIEDVSGINPKWAEDEKEYRKKMLPLILAFVQQMNEVNKVATQKARAKMNKKDREKLDLIAKQEKTSPAPISNAGKLRPHRPISVAPVEKKVEEKKVEPKKPTINISEKLESLVEQNRQMRERERDTQTYSDKSESNKVYQINNGRKYSTDSMHNEKQNTTRSTETKNVNRPHMGKNSIMER